MRSAADVSADSSRGSADSVAANAGRIQPGEDSVAGDLEHFDSVPESANSNGDSSAPDEDLDSNQKVMEPGKEPIPPTLKRITREQSFPAQSFGEGLLIKSLETPRITSQITMVRNYPPVRREVVQVIRPKALDRFEQGNSGAKESQIFEQVIDRPVDIVLVIDNSGSMSQEQTNMASKLSPLLNFIEDSDWQIGVVTTDPSQGCQRGLIKKGDANAATAFSKAVTAGTSGSGNERGVLQAVSSLAGSCLPSPWIRSNSTVAVLIVSDEDNCSANGADCPGKDYGKADYLFNYLASIREPGKNARVYGIYWSPTERSTSCSTGGNQAVQYSSLVERTSGTWGSICASDYTPTLTAISKDIRTVLNSKFTLTYAPVPGSVSVSVDGASYAGSVTVTGKVVELTPAPGAGAKVRIDYRHDSTPILSSFSLRYPADPKGLEVTLDGAKVDSSDYRLSADHQLIEWNVPPPEYAQIEVSYTRSDKALPQIFDMGESIRPASMVVSVNGQDWSGFRLDQSRVVMDSPPPDGSAVVFAYQAIGDPVLNYPFSPGGISQATAPKGLEVTQSLEVKDSATGDTLPFTYSQGSLTFSSADFVEGRTIEVGYENPGRQFFTLDLPVAPLPDVKAIGGSVECEGDGRLLIHGKTVQVQNCGFATDVNSITLVYRYLMAQHTSFTFNGDHLPLPEEFQLWTVKIDGVETTDFVRVGNRVDFAYLLPLGANVTISLVQEVK